MSNNIKVSIVIPVFNNEKCIKDCLDSVLNQTLRDIQIICVNDGSTDNTLTVLNSYSKKDSRILILNQENSGPGAARNAGIRVADGKYLYFVDSDDKIENDCLETLFNLSEKNNTEMCLVGVNAFDDKTNSYFPYMNFSTKNFKKGELIHKDKKKFLDMLFFRTGGCFYFYKKIFFVENNLFFNEEYLLGEDVLTSLKAKLKVPFFSVCNSDLYHYKVNQDNSITSSFDNKKIDNLFSYLKDIYKFLIEENKWEKYKKYYYDYCSFSIFSYFLVSEKKYFLDKLIKFNKELSLIDNNVMLFSDRKIIEQYIVGTEDISESYDLRYLSFYAKSVINTPLINVWCSLSRRFIKISIFKKNIFTSYMGIRKKAIYLLGRRIYKKTLF